MKRNLIPSLSVYFIFYIFFLFHLTSNFSASHDSIDYLHEFETGINLIQPHHLFYHFTTYGIFRALQWVLPTVKSYYLIESITAAWASGIMVVVYQIMRNRFRKSPLISFLTCCMISFSFGFWYYSTNIEVYMPPLFFILLTLNELCKKNMNTRRAIVFNVLAILFHQVNVLLAPILIWKLWSERKEKNFRRSLTQYVLIGGGSVIVIYVIAGWIVLDHFTFPDLMHWAEGYTNSSKYWFPLKWSTLFNALVGLGHAFVGGQFMFQIPFIRSFLEGKFFYHNLTDEIFLVRNLSVNAAYLLFFLSIILLITLAVITILIVKNLRKIIRAQKEVVFPFLLFLLIYSVFFFFWMPENLEFWIPQSVVIWILIGGLSQYWSKGASTKYFLFGIAAALYVINFWGSVKWLLNIENDIFYAKTKKVCGESNPSDIILLEDYWITDGYLKRCSQSKIYKVPEKNDTLERKMLETAITDCLGSHSKIFIFQEKTFMHGIKDESYVDSLFRVYHDRVKDFNEPLTPIKVIE